MEIERLVVGPLRTNCYLLNDGGDCIIIDPGGDHDVIIEQIEKKGILPKMILATHAHFDHILSVSALKSRFDVPFLLNRKDGAILETFIQYSKTYADIDPGAAPIPDNHFRNLDSLKFGNKSVRVVETPGHTPGSCSFIVDNSMFSGDFIFEGSIGRTDFGGSYTEMSRSIQWAKSLGVNLDIYPGHGEFTTLEEEKKSNPFFKKLF